MAQDWEIKPRSQRCSRCNAQFVDGQTYYSALHFDNAGYNRGDYCETCWLAGSGSGAPPYSLWKGIYTAPTPPPEEPLKKETAETLLRRLIEEEDSRRAAVIYVLAVMLERKKILVERDVQMKDDGLLVRVYEHRRTGESFVITDPRLSLDRLQPVQEEVVSLLGHRQTQSSSAEPGTDEGCATDAPDAKNA